MKSNDLKNQKPQTGADEQVQKKKMRRRVITGTIIVIIIIIILLLLRSCGGPTAAPEETPSQGITWDADSEEGGLNHRSEEEIQEELNRKVAEGMINISMNTSPVFETGTSKGNLLIVNSEMNNYPQMVYIIRNDTGEEIYRSGAIAVGSKIENAKLAVDLDPGTYACTAYFNNVNMETGEILGTAGAEIEITVKG